ncbi:MAG: solute carrier family 23 protein [Anaerolineales bacterium]
MAISKITGYLPNETAPLGQLILLGFQHVLTKFPATVFVAAFCGFHMGTVLLASGVSPLWPCFFPSAGWALTSPCSTDQVSVTSPPISRFISQMTGSTPQFGVPVADEVLSTLQAGIVVTGILNIIVGSIIRSVGKQAIDRILPPMITGLVAAIIGFGLAFAAPDLANAKWGVAIVTLMLTVLFSVYCSES